MNGMEMFYIGMLAATCICLFLFSYFYWNWQDSLTEAYQRGYQDGYDFATWEPPEMPMEEKTIDELLDFDRKNEALFNFFGVVQDGKLREDLELAEDGSIRPREVW